MEKQAKKKNENPTNKISFKMGKQMRLIYLQSNLSIIHCCINLQYVRTQHNHFKIERIPAALFTRSIYFGMTKCIENLYITFSTRETNN